MSGRNLEIDNLLLDAIFEDVKILLLEVVLIAPARSVTTTSSTTRRDCTCREYGLVVISSAFCCCPFPAVANNTNTAISVANGNSRDSITTARIDSFRSSFRIVPIALRALIFDINLTGSGHAI
jgi:hypothetical protein